MNMMGYGNGVMHLFTCSILFLALSANGLTPDTRSLRSEAKAPASPTQGAATVAPPEPAVSGPGLRDYARRHRFNIGTCAPLFALRNDVDQGRFNVNAAKEFNLIELENELKPPSIWTGPREYNFRDVDFVLGEPGKTGWAQQHKVKLRGHVLVYAQDGVLPRWVRTAGADLTKEDAAALLHDYIHALVGRYRGKVAMWDVVNEAIDDRPNNNPFNLRSSFWFRKLGPDFIALAFKWAHEADPRAELYYNDYGIEEGGVKGQHMLDLAKWLKDQHAPIAGLGLQYHIQYTSTFAPGDAHYKFVDDIRKLRLAYMITELDVAVPVQQLPADDPNRGQLPANPADLDTQAKTYAGVFQMALSTRNCHGINIWGLTDGHSWIPGFSRGRSGLATLFTRDYAPKPAYLAVQEVLKK